MSVPTPLRARQLLIFLMLAGASLRALSCDVPLDLPAVVGPPPAVNQYMSATPDGTSPSSLPVVLRSVSAVLDPPGASDHSNRTIPLGLRN